VTGIVLAHLTHLLSVLVLHRLALLLRDTWEPRKIAFVTAFLHIISPAGLFLSAPYAEAPFAFLNFSGVLLYVLGLKARYLEGTAFQEAVGFISAGMCFGLASMVRSNGLFSGLLFAYDLVTLASELVQSGITTKKAYQAVLTVLGGTLVAIGYVAPQLVAHHEYCTMASGTKRIWCNRTIPSIYTWVQDHYW
jgi:GPI mannosyltransferase 2